MSDLHLESERISGPGGLVSSILGGDQESLGLFPLGVFGPVKTPVGARSSLESNLGTASFHCTEPAARDRLEASLAGEGLVVTTGQQPQLFGGPLYVLYKALSAVRAAARIERELDTPCVAVFWVAADDHDWPEVATVSYLDRDEQLRRLKLTAPPDRAGRPVGPSLLPAEVEELTREFLDSLETRETGDRGRISCEINIQPAALSPRRSSESPPSGWTGFRSLSSTQLTPRSEAPRNPSCDECSSSATW